MADEPSLSALYSRAARTEGDTAQPFILLVARLRDNGESLDTVIQNQRVIKEMFTDAYVETMDVYKRELYHENHYDKRNIKQWSEANDQQKEKWIASKKFKVSISRLAQDCYYKLKRRMERSTKEDEDEGDEGSSGGTAATASRSGSSQQTAIIVSTPLLDLHAAAAAARLRVGSARGSTGCAGTGRGGAGGLGELPPAEPPAPAPPAASTEAAAAVAAAGAAAGAASALAAKKAAKPAGICSLQYTNVLMCRCPT